MPSSFLYWQSLAWYSLAFYCQRSLESNVDLIPHLSLFRHKAVHQHVAGTTLQININQLLLLTENIVALWKHLGKGEGLGNRKTSEELNGVVEMVEIILGVLPVTVVVDEAVHATQTLNRI